MAEPSLLSTLIAAAAGVFGGLVSPVFKILDRRRERQEAEEQRKRALIATWRKMVLDVASQAGDSHNVAPLLLKHPDYLTLEPYLTAELQGEIYSDEVVLGDNAVFPHHLVLLKDEIDRLEGSWGLRR